MIFIYLQVHKHGPSLDQNKNTVFEYVSSNPGKLKPESDPKKPRGNLQHPVKGKCTNN